MASLRNTKKTVSDILEGVISLTLNSLWGNSPGTLKELEKDLINTQNRLISDTFLCEMSIGSSQDNIKIQRIENALDVLNEYFKRHRIH